MKDDIDYVDKDGNDMIERHLNNLIYYYNKWIFGNPKIKEDYYQRIVFVKNRLRSKKIEHLKNKMNKNV